MYLSASWLSELYQQVLVTNFLQHAGYDPNGDDEYLPLVNLLSGCSNVLVVHNSF